jgi:rubrerythrin
MTKLWRCRKCERLVNRFVNGWVCPQCGWYCGQFIAHINRGP